MRKSSIKKLLCLLLAAAALLCTETVNASAAETAGYYPIRANDFVASGKIWIAGDSIAADHSYEDKNDYARFVHGWGEVIGDYLTGGAQVFNGGISGQSAKYFIEEENYQTIMEGIGAGDLLLISFGHNDYKSAGTTHATLGSDVEGSYKWYLKNYYIDPALSVGAMPVLCTSVVLGVFNDGTISQNQTQMQFVRAMKELYEEYAAQGVEIGLIDTNSLTRDFYNAVDDAGEYFALRYDSSAHTSTSLDRVHSSLAGANVIADMLVQNLCLMYPDFARYCAQPAFDGGAGTADDPYRISTWLQLAWFLQNTKLNTPDTYIALTADLTPRLQNTEAQTTLYAHLDGGGHSIKNPTGNVMRSFVDVNYGTIANLKLSYNSDYTSAVMPTAFVGVNHGIIENCSAGGTLTVDYYPDTAGETLFYGIFAAENAADGVIRSCTCSADVTLGTHVSHTYLGGIAGTNAGVIESCTANGQITLDAYEYDSSDPLEHGEIVCLVGGITALTDENAEPTDCTGSTPKCHCKLTGTIEITQTGEIFAATNESLSALLANARRGDVDADGKVTTSDAQLALQYAMGLLAPTEDTLTRADVDADGQITLRDARKLLRAALQIESL